MGITGAHHTSYTVADIKRSLVFYRDLLGFDLIQERPEVTADYFRAIVGLPDCVVYAVLMKIPGTSHHLELFEYIHPRADALAMRPNAPGSSHIAYHVDDLNGLYHRLKDAGVDTFVSSPVYLDKGPNAGGWAVYLRDPDGIYIELFQPPPVKN
jgi:catechol 2,3-dioxygenase-like lactoylglutathione lyase family enzyme